MLSHQNLVQLQTPIAGRISEFIPFLPFTPGEQAVVVHKSLLELNSSVRKMISLPKGPNKRLIGRVEVHLQNYTLVCTTTVREWYNKDQGARNLNRGVQKIKERLVEEYLDIYEEITEHSGEVDFFVDVVGEEIGATLLSTVESEEL